MCMWSWFRLELLLVSGLLVKENVFFFLHCILFWGLQCEVLHFSGPRVAWSRGCWLTAPSNNVPTIHMQPCTMNYITMDSSKHNIPVTREETREEIVLQHSKGTYPSRIEVHVLVNILYHHGTHSKSGVLFSLWEWVENVWIWSMGWEPFERKNRTHANWAVPVRLLLQWPISATAVVAQMH